jgi:hypothetical protein
MPKNRINSSSGKRAPSGARRPHKLRADTMTTTVTETDLKRLSMRLLGDAINAPVIVRPGTSLGLKDKHDNPFGINPPWGVIPFLLKMQGGEIPVEEIMQAMNNCAVAKNEFTRRGQYYEAWQWGWRERLIARVLKGLTTFGIVGT